MHAQAQRERDVGGRAGAEGEQASCCAVAVGGGKYMIVILRVVGLVAGKWSKRIGEGETRELVSPDWYSRDGEIPSKGNACKRPKTRNKELTT